ncbi:MAG: hypothetical protein M1334_02555 [Patescibacteria group bacterium]|nr:hypothetical protein [Patescibacteria group bacterium]
MTTTPTLPDQILGLEKLLYSNVLSVAVPDGKLLFADSLNLFFKYLGDIKLISIAITIILLFGALYFVVASNWPGLNRLFASAIEKKAKNKKLVNKSWLKIKKLMSYNDEGHFKLAIIEADNVLDNILKSADTPGETLGERLKSLNPAQLPNLNEVWEAHKIRNRLVHEPDYSLDSQTAARTISFYEKAFKGLELID